MAQHGKVAPDEAVTGEMLACDHGKTFAASVHLDFWRTAPNRASRVSSRSVVMARLRTAGARSQDARGIRLTVRDRQYLAHLDKLEYTLY